jgi:hypothetical protein
MEERERERARELMERFAVATGLTSDAEPRRYLWTDAFAVCNWLGLGDAPTAMRLVGQVHHVLGRHRPDDPREGRLSGLPEDEAVDRPTAGGLRIGKPLPERGAHDRYDPHLEWDRDGQYFHYLTRWVHALDRVADVTGEARLREWAVELADVAFRGFSHGIGPAPNQLHWKMSIDLSRPLVPSMGQHDPLDGFTVIGRLRHHARSAGLDASVLDGPIDALAAMADGMDWATEDPLGAGALLTTAWSLAPLLGPDQPRRAGIMDRVMDAAVRSLLQIRDTRLMDLPATRRMPFRELGLAIGLAAVERLDRETGELYLTVEQKGRLDQLVESTPLGRAITAFWHDPANQRGPTWIEQEDINTVMLATAVSPDGYLG